MFIALASVKVDNYIIISHEKNRIEITRKRKIIGKIYGLSN